MEKVMTNPKRAITRNGEKYIYTGEIPNKYIVKESTRYYVKDQGRKLVFVENKGDPTVIYVYISAKFYKNLLSTLYPAYGMGVLK